MRKPIAILSTALSLILAQGAPALAQDGPITAQTLIDRAQILDLLTRYYYNFGKAEGDSFSSFYADDALFVLGPTTYKGKDEIAGAYKSIGAGPTNPAANRFSFNVLMTNPLIVVHGDTATAQLIFTEIVMDTATAPPRLLTQGREYDTLVRVKGAWRFSKRQIVAGTTPPAGWAN
jgi:hypothetical protein